MLTLTVSNKAPKPVVQQQFPAPVQTSYYNGSMNVRTFNNAAMLAEADRRDSVIKELYKNCEYVIGDVCVPAEEADKNEHPEVVVLDICDGYASYKPSGRPWKKSNNPMIVYAQDTVNNTFFYCTTNYLKKK